MELGGVTKEQVEKSNEIGKKRKNSTRKSASSTGSFNMSLFPSIGAKLCVLRAQQMSSSLHKVLVITNNERGNL